MKDKLQTQKWLGITPDEQVPHFITNARPEFVPPELLALAFDARITYEQSMGSYQGSGTTNAGDYRDEMRKTIARQSEGLFTVNEAAQVLADARAGKTGKEWVGEFRAAHCAGALAIRDVGSCIPYRPANPSEHAQIPITWTAKQKTERDFQDLVRESDLDAWLRSTAGYGFPAAGRSPASRVVETPEQRRARLLAMHDAEVASGGKRGALSRVVKQEKQSRPNVDRSNIGKDITKARQERDAERRGGGLARLLG